MSRSLVERASDGRLAPSPLLSEAKDPSDLAAEMMDKGMNHFVLKDLDKQRSELEKALAKAKKELDGQRKIGMGETEALTLLKVTVLPAFKAYADKLNKATAAVEQVANTHSRY